MDSILLQINMLNMKTCFLCINVFKYINIFREREREFLCKEDMVVVKFKFQNSMHNVKTESK